MSLCHILCLFLAILFINNGLMAQEQQLQTEAPKCGTAENDYAPCVGKDRADKLFKDCCQQYAPEGCQSLCQYETDELKARNLVLFFD